MAAVVEAIITSRNCSISSSSSSGRSSSCNSFLSYKKIAIVMAMIIAKIRLRILASVPKLRITTVMRHRLKRVTMF